MATNTEIPSVYSTQWRNGNYEVINSCMKELCKAVSDRQAKISSVRRSPVEHGGFWSRFWRRSKANDKETTSTTKSDRSSDDTDDMLEGEDPEKDKANDAGGSQGTDTAHVEISHNSLEKLKKGAILGFRDSLFHLPHLIPKRKPSLGLNELGDYIRKNFPGLEKAAEGIDAYSALANVDQELCCEMLQEGICFYGEESQQLSEGMIIEGMLHSQSMYQLKSLMKLFSLFNSNMTMATDCVSDDHVFPESVDILRDLVSKGLVKNMCLLLMAAIKEAARYHSSISGDIIEISQVLYEHSVETINRVLCLLEMYFLRFHPMSDDIKRIIMLIPHVLCINTLLDVKDYTSAMGALFDGVTNCSAWYPPSANAVSYWIGIREFDELTNEACNITNRLLLILMMALHPQHYRLSISESTSGTLYASLASDNQFLERMKMLEKPFRKHKNLETVMEFIIFGMYFNDMERAIKCIDAGVFKFLGVNMIDSTHPNQRGTVVQILDLMMELYLLKDGSLNKNWYDILDYEVSCKRNAEDRVRLVFTGAVDEKLFRHPACSVIEVLSFLRKIGTYGNKSYMFQVWKSCVEVYRSVVPNVSCQLYKYNSFENRIYNCRDSDGVDQKILNSLVYPCKGFSWWERNNALLELVAQTASDHSIYVKTYPLFLTCILEFGIYLSGFDNLGGKPGGHLVGEFLSTGAFRELTFPFLLEQIVSQIGSFTKGHYNNLHLNVYKRLLARDDQIETAEAAINIASSIPAKHSQHVSAGGFMRRMYTFPFISNVNEVKVALSTLGLGGDCPYGLIETATAAFQLIAHCDKIPRQPRTAVGGTASSYVNVQCSVGEEQNSLLNAVFSILSCAHIEGTELLTSSVLSSLCSAHIRDSETAAAALSKIAELLHDPGSTLSRGFTQKASSLSTEELCAFIKCVKTLFIVISRKHRFESGRDDWLQRLVEFFLWVLDNFCLRKESVEWDMISDVIDFLLEVSKGPIDTRGGMISRGSQYVLEQLLIPASTSCISLVRAATEAKLIPAISLLCILFKRDIVLLLAHRAALLTPSGRVGDVCNYCDLPYANGIDDATRKSRYDMKQEGIANSFHWWSNKIRKINSILSSSRPQEQSFPQQCCDCVKIEMRPVSLLMAQDAIIKAMNTLRGALGQISDLSSRCDFIGDFDEGSPEEFKIKCVYILLQMQERMGIESLTVSNKVIKSLQRFYWRSQTCEDLTFHVMNPKMEAEDLILYNKLSNMIATTDPAESIEYRYFCMSHLSDLNRCGLDNMILLLLKQCALKASYSKNGNNLGSKLLGSDSHIIALIRLASGGGSEPWRFEDYRRVDALASLLFFAKSSSHVSSIILSHWRDLENDLNKFDFNQLNCESYIIQCQRLSFLLELIVVLAKREKGSIVIGDIISYVKLYSRFVKAMGQVTEAVAMELEPVIKETVEAPDGIGISGFLHLWRRASFQSNVIFPFDIQLSTMLLNPEAATCFHKNMRRYAMRMNSFNILIASSTSLISCLLNFISQCSNLNILGISEKSGRWLEVAAAEFNPDETSELKLGLQITLIKHIARVWLSSNTGARGNDTTLAISISLKLMSFILTRETSTQLRSKVYACLNILLTNKVKLDCPQTSELLVAHLLSQSSEMHKQYMQDKGTLLQMIFSDATSMEKEPSFNDHYARNDNISNPEQDETMDPGIAESSRSEMDIECRSLNHNAPMSMDVGCGNMGRQIIVGDDYGIMSSWKMKDRGVRHILEIQKMHSREMIFIAADCGMRVDYRVESLTLLSSLASALQKFEATTIEYDVGTVSYGSLGAISTGSVSKVIENRFMQFKRCKQCEMHLPCCPSCTSLLTGAACALKAISELQQFSTFWFHVQPTSTDTCLVDLFLSCDLLLGFNKFGNMPIEFFHPFISILENLLYMPSIKTRNCLIQWINRHEEILSTLLSVADDVRPNEERVSVICSLLRIYRVCMLWLLAEYRIVKFQKENMANFSLIMADLQCKFPLAVSVPRCIPPLLGVLTRDIQVSTEVYWQCILLCLQTVFPELGGFEVDLDFSMQTPIMTLAIEKASTVMEVLTRCGSHLLKFMNKLSKVPSNVKRNALGSFALRASTIDCATTLLEYILAMVLTHNTNKAGNIPLSATKSNNSSDDLDMINREDCATSHRGKSTDAMARSSGMVSKLKKMLNASKVEAVLDKIATVCQENCGSSDYAVGSRRKHVLGERMIEHLAPYDLEHVASFRSSQQYNYSYNSVYTLLLSSVCNVAVVLERYYGCKFSSHVLSGD